MKIWVVSAKVEEIQAEGVDRVFDSKEKADMYVKEQQMNEILFGLLKLEQYFNCSYQRLDKV
jgi:hypothetical protein